MINTNCITFMEENKMDAKWYSNGLTAEEAEKMQKVYGRIEKPVYGVDIDSWVLALRFLLSGDGAVISCELTDTEDIKALLIRTKAYEVSRLEGKVLEALIERDVLPGLGMLRGLSPPI